MHLHTFKRPVRGFTLVELMIVVVIAAILLAVAVPAYTTSMRKARRSEAKTALLDLAGREERYLSTNPAGYTKIPADLGLTGTFPMAVGQNQYYTANICTTAAGNASGCPPSNLQGPSFVITATPAAGGPQVGDTQCATFAVDSGGQQFSTGSLATAQCWSN